MSSEASQEGLRFPKHYDFASTPEFESARDQLQKSIHKHKAHLLPSSRKESGRRMSLVLEEMWDHENGMLRSYRKFKGHRNFRYGFVEKVLEKVTEIQAIYNLAGTEGTESIKRLSEIARLYFDVKHCGKEAAKIRKKQAEKDKEIMVKKEDQMGFIPKPAYIPQETVETPTDSTSVVDEDLPDDLGEVEISSFGSAGSPKKRRKNISISENAETIGKDDTIWRLHEVIIDILGTINESLRRHLVPHYDYGHVAQQESNVEKIDELLAIEKELASQGFDTNPIRLKIQNLANNIANSI